jgi:hypothetical protein
LLVGALHVGCPARWNTVVLYNTDPNYSIIELNLAPANTADWRLNLLIEPLAPWQRTNVTGVEDGQYDLRVIYDRSGAHGSLGDLWVTATDVEITGNKVHTVTATTAGLTVE